MLMNSRQQHVFLLQSWRMFCLPVLVKCNADRSRKIAKMLLLFTGVSLYIVSIMSEVVDYIAKLELL